MAGLYAADGSWNVTVVDGTAYVGLYGADGSINVIQSDGDMGPLMHPCGAIRVTLTDVVVPGLYVADGSWYCCETPFVSGALRVTTVNGTSFGASIQITNDTIIETSPAGTDVGVLSVINGSGSYTFTITSDPDNKFALNVDGVTLEVDQLTDYESDTEHSVTIEADNGVDDPISRIFTISVSNVVAAILTSPTDVETSDTAGTLTVTTDKDDGTLYVVVTTSSTPPSAAQVKAGQDHLGAAADFADDQAIDSTGPKIFTATGLTGSTQYYTYFMHERSPAEQSSVSAADGFITEAPVGGDPLPYFIIIFR